MDHRGGDLDLNGLGGLDLNDGSGGVGGDGSSVDNRGSGVGGNGSNSLGQRIDKSVLVDVLGESLQRQRSQSSVGGHEVTEGSGQRTGNSSVDVGVSSGSSNGTADDGAENSKGLHVDVLVWQPILPM